MMHRFAWAVRLLVLVPLVACAAGEASAPLAPTPPVGSPNPAAPATDSLVVTPQNFTITSGDTVRLRVADTTTRGARVDSGSLTWGATGGQVDGNGLFTASGPGAANVSVSLASRSGRSRGTVTAKVVRSIRVTPDSVSVSTGGTAAFAAQIVWSDGSFTSAAQWRAQGGTISAAGQFTAGTAAGRYLIIGSDPNGTRSDTAIVAVTAPVVAPPPAPVIGCANPSSSWIFCDDFEQDRTARYFEYDAAAGRFARAAGTGRSGSTAMRAHFDVGTVGAGSLKLAIGRTPSTYFRPVDAGTANYRELWWRVYLRNQDGWIGGGGEKLTRATVLASSNWAQAMIAHVWSGGTAEEYLVLDPATGTSDAGALVTTGYNDFTNLRWLGAATGSSRLFGGPSIGQWHCIEAHVRLNTASNADGLFELFIDGRADAQRSGLNWLGAFNSYGINAVFLENFWNDGSPASQDRFIDDFVVASQRVGC